MNNILKYNKISAMRKRPEGHKSISSAVSCRKKHYLFHNSLFFRILHKDRETMAERTQKRLTKRPASLNLCIQRLFLFGALVDRITRESLVAILLRAVCVFKVHIESLDFIRLLESKKILRINILVV